MTKYCSFVCMYVCTYTHTENCPFVCLCIYKHIHEILTFATIWMGPEGITINEISKTEEDRGCYHLYAESEK